MDAQAVERLLLVQEMAMGDSRYGALLAEYRTRDRQLLEMLPTLEEAQRNTVMDMIGLIFEMHSRMLLIACSLGGRDQSTSP